MKWISLFLLTLQTTMQVFVIKWARSGSGAKSSLSTSIVLFTELLKMMVSFSFEVYETGSVEEAARNVYVHFTRDWMETLKVTVPSVLYTIQNNLMYISLANLSMAVQQVTYQLKILTTAVLSVLIMGTKLGNVRWASLFLLVAGVSLVQWRSNDGSATSLDQSSSRDPVKGVVAVIIACFTSGLASVYLEKLLKKTEVSIWVRNVQLGFFGSIVGLIQAFLWDFNAIAEGGLFQGFDRGVVCVIFTTAYGGLLCAAVLKYADNISRCFSTALSIILTSWLSWVRAEFEPSLLFVLGTVLALIATFLYSLGLPQRWHRLRKSSVD